MKKLGFGQWVWGLVCLFAMGSVVGACGDDEGIADGDEVQEALIPNLPGEMMTRAALVRTFGVGYGYDGLNGRLCDFNSLRNRVIGDWIKEETGFKTDVKVEDHFGQNINNYLEGLNWGVNAGVNVAEFLKGEVDYKYAYFKSASSSYYIGTSNRIYTVVNSRYSDDDLDAEPMFQGNYYYSPGFDAALKVLKKYRYPDHLIDTFFEVFGTHVVVSADLGGKLELDIMMDQSCTNSLKETALGWRVALLYMFNKASHKEVAQYFKNVTNNYKARMNVHGGNVELLNPFLNRANLDFEKRISEDYLDKWVESICYDAENLKKNTAEIVDLEARPIWEFVQDEGMRIAMERRYDALAAKPSDIKIDGNGNFVWDSPIYVPLDGAHDYIGENDVSIYYLDGKPLLSCIPNMKVLNVLGKAYFPLQNGIEQFDGGVFISDDGVTFATIKISVNADGTLGNININNVYSQEGRRHYYMNNVLQMVHSKLTPVSNSDWQSGKLPLVNATVTRLVACESFDLNSMLYYTIYHLPNTDANLHVSFRVFTSPYLTFGWLRNGLEACRNNLTFRYLVPKNVSWKNTYIVHYPDEISKPH